MKVNAQLLPAVRGTDEPGFFSALIDSCIIIKARRGWPFKHSYIEINTAEDLDSSVTYQDLNSSTLQLTFRCDLNLTSFTEDLIEKIIKLL